MRVNTLIMLAVMLIAGCATCAPLPGPGPSPTTTTFTLTQSTTSSASSNCAKACEHLRALGCPAGNPTAKGTTCEQDCANAEASGLAIWGTGCIVGSASCGEADSCGGPT